MNSEIGLIAYKRLHLFAPKLSRLFLLKIFQKMKIFTPVVDGNLLFTTTTVSHCQELLFEQIQYSQTFLLQKLITQLELGLYCQTKILSEHLVQANKHTKSDTEEGSNFFCFFCSSDLF